MSAPVLLLKGSDQVLLGDAARKALAELVGTADSDEVVDLFSGDDFELADAVMAATSVSMFGDRVIVIRNASRFNVEALAPLINYTADPNPTSKVLVVWDKPLGSSAHAHAVPKKLSDAIKACGGAVIDCDVSSNAKARSGWLDEQLGAATVRFSPAAKQALVARLGEDVSRLSGVLRVLEATFAAGTTLGPADIEPYVGEAGSVPPWELTDAIDKGDVADAVTKLRRMMRAGERHPLQLMSSLLTHFGRMLKLDGAAVRSEKEAAELLGMKGSTFPAKKAMNQARSLGSERIARAVSLLAAADVDLRGRNAVPPEATMEVLVARLAQLSRPSGGRGRR
ncbi:MAG: DNA polymerase III subunit delta [Actinobacteria bacterium]|nr:DNA polymerase III subunit delta [Actinomycetota bacterium]